MLAASKILCRHPAVAAHDGGEAMGSALATRDDIAAAALRQLVRLEDDGRVACRLLALANALDGMRRATAARQAGMDRQTPRDWVLRFNQEGVEGLRDRPRSGRPSFLSEGAQESMYGRSPREEEATLGGEAICRHVCGLCARRLEAAGPDGFRGPLS
jgi:hypothetical protein